MENSGSRTLRLMHLVIDLDPGGTQRLVIEMSKRLRQQAEVYICCLDERGEWAQGLADLGFPVFALGRQPGFRPALALGIADLARRHKVDVLHCHHYTPFVYGALAARLCPGLRVVYTEHGRVADAPPSRKRRLANVVLSRLSGQFFAVSQELREHMLREGFPGGRVQVIYNGIDVGPLPTAGERAAARRILGVPEGALVIGTVARLDPVKDLSTLIEAFAALSREHMEAHLVLIGEGPERSRLERIAGEAGVLRRAHFTGVRNDARRLLSAFDIYANTSLTEGVSVTILEAMAAGRSVIATEAGGTPEVVADGETGVLVPIGDPERLVESLRVLASESARRDELGQNGRDRVSRCFSLDQMVDSYLRVYNLDDQQSESEGRA